MSSVVGRQLSPYRFPRQHPISCNSLLIRAPSAAVPPFEPIGVAAKVTSQVRGGVLLSHCPARGEFNGLASACHVSDSNSLFGPWPKVSGEGAGKTKNLLNNAMLSEGSAL